jgi:hypothetical protein
MKGLRNIVLCQQTCRGILAYFMYFLRKTLTEDSVKWHLLGAFAKLQKRLLGSSCVPYVCPPVCPHGTNRRPLKKIFMKFYIWIFHKNLLRNFKFHWNLTRIRGTLHEELCTFVIIILRMRNIWDKVFRENQNTHSMFNNSFPRKSWHFWDKVEKYGTSRQATEDNVIWRMRFVW